jgi:hypothetical protein
MNKYDLQGLFEQFDQFKKESTDSSSDLGKGNKAAGGRARALSLKIDKALKEFRKQSVAGNV